MAAYPISIPGGSSRRDVMSPSSMASPLSISSPYSAHSSLSNNSTAQTLASSFATSVTSNASALSPSDSVSNGIDGGAGTASAKKHKPHECDVCGACFARKVHLQRHSLRHQVCKPYCCDRCGKCFSRQDSLVRHHRLLHEKTKEKPKRMSSSKKKNSKEGVCTRCSNLGVKCDGKLPCSRCSTSEYNAQQCTPVTRADKRSERRQSVSQMRSSTTPSSFGDLDEDESMSVGEEAETAFSPFGDHGPRRNTVSNMESTALHNNYSAAFPHVFSETGHSATSSWAPHHVQQPHPFEMPQMEPSSYTDVKSLHPQQLHQHMSAPATATHQPFFEASQPDQDVPLFSLFQQASAHEASTASNPTFDWSSMMHGHVGEERAGEPLPFSKSASDKSLNVTLSSGPEDISCFPSPSVHALQKVFPTEEQQQAGAAAAAAASMSLSHANGTVNLASLGLPVPPNLNISVPADLQMSAENWDNLMRCLTSMATRQAEPMKA